jgi:hypothetical protein
MGQMVSSGCQPTAWGKCPQGRFTEGPWPGGQVAREVMGEGSGLLMRTTTIPFRFVCQDLQKYCTLEVA